MDDDKVVYMEDLEKRKKAYGICGECNEPGTGYWWCQACNAKRFKKNFKNWSSGNKDIDELIQFSQLNAPHRTKYLEWIPYENFQNVTYITRGGFGTIYSAEWPEGCISYWDIDNQEWHRYNNCSVALKNSDFLNEVKSYLQIYSENIVQCYGITQNPNTKDYMMVLQYYTEGNLRDYYLNNDTDYLKIFNLLRIVTGLLNIHIAEKVHKDIHPGNILINMSAHISDLGMCQPVNNEEQTAKKGIYGVLPYIAPEVLRGYQYTKAADIYSFGIIMNEYLSEEIPFSGTPKFLADLIIKCWDSKTENRPTAKELYQVLTKLDKERWNGNCEFNSQLRPYSCLNCLSFNNLPEPVNSSDLSSFQVNSDIVIIVSSVSANPVSECYDCKI
ncbi:kinase-like domain-containing protein [Rhizophagus clarus]|uniref:Kinase-like domain-containing protein n=1 Tax=Rhizophagus clarus TaxID=94130 RepID=A0A8H3QZH7_9GLOM|nr:kinase-like domain-containing protein [Rhizophagus clarus]